MKAREKAALYRELAKLTDADFHLDRSLTLLLGQKPPAQKRAYLEGMQRGLTAGLGVAQSISQNNAALVSSLENALIEAGERSGKLGTSFNHLARYFSAMDGAARQARGAMIYPLILLHLAILLPEIPAALTAEEGEGPVNRILLALGILWGLVLGGGWLWKWLTEKAQSSPRVDGILNRLPFIGSARRHWALARFTQVFHSGLLAALRMSETTELAGNASQSGCLRAASQQASAQIQKGEQLAEALADTDAFPWEFLNAVATAEESGKLDEEMARWTVAETMLANVSVEQASLWLPKIGYVLIVGFTAYRIIMMVQGIYAGLYQMVPE